jgi:hypothetical protein
MSAELFFRERRTTPRQRARENVVHVLPVVADDARGPGEQPPKVISLPSVADLHYAYVHGAGAWAAGALVVTEGAPR